MKSRLFGVLGASCFLALALGCSEPVSMEEFQQTPSTETKAETSPVETENTSVESTEPEDEYQLKKAGVGATGKGQYGVASEQPMSIITTPVSTYFYAQEKTVFDMQIPQALNLFQASEGRYPNSEEEFMNKIIKANMIVLPKLPEGDSYVYDVPSHTLMVRTVKK